MKAWEYIKIASSWIWLKKDQGKVDIKLDRQNQIFNVKSLKGRDVIKIVIL